jgi:hypothetical protein
LKPAWASLIAADEPAGPAPAIATSNFLSQNEDIISITG